MSKYADKFYKLFGLRKIMYLGLVSVLLGIIGTFIIINIKMGPVVLYALIALIAIVPTTQILGQLTFNSLIHHRVRSGIRATMLSVSQTYNHLTLGLGMILIKPLLDGYGIECLLLLMLAILPLMLYPLTKVLSIKKI
jgi:hypothetical protein